MPIVSLTWAFFLLKNIPAEKAARMYYISLTSIYTGKPSFPGIPQFVAVP